MFAGEALLTTKGTTKEYFCFMMILYSYNKN